ncbi:MAG: hypothetical protein ACREQ5_21320 [Candidatus Dormibacteria bacterium]
MTPALVMTSALPRGRAPAPKIGIEPVATGVVGILLTRGKGSRDERGPPFGIDPAPD